MNTQYRRFLMLGSLALLVLFACEKWDFEKAAFTEVITVGALEVEFNSAFLLGDIEGLRNANIIETGFILSTNTTTDQNLRLGEPGILQFASPANDSIITTDRAFAARVVDLNPSTKYFYRAYIRLESNENAYGTIDTFITNNLVISAPTITRNSANCPDSITVTINVPGANISPRSSFGLVWSSDAALIYPTLASGQSKEVTSPEQNGILQLNLPIECNSNYFIRGFYKVGDQETYSSIKAFTTIAGGTWIPREEFPGPVLANRGQSAFAIDQTAYLVGGFRDGSCDFSSLVWEYDAITDQWTSANVEGIERVHGSALTQGSTGFVFSGLGPEENCDLNSCISCPCACRCHKDDYWIIEGGIWRKESKPFSKIHRAVSFVINDEAFMGTGSISSGCVASGSISINDFWRFDPNSPTLSSVDPLPGPGREVATGFSFGNKGYVGGGTDFVFTDFYEFDPSQPSGFQWKEIVVPSDLRVKITNPEVISLESYALFVAGSGYDFSTFSFDPTKESKWANLTTLSLSGGDFADLNTSLAINDLAYVVVGRKKNNFWMYIPELE